MSIFKCKMCGGDLNIVEGTTTVECDYCGTKQTVPKSMDPNMQNLFNRANTMRMRGEFDKAAQIYEKIVQADNTQSDAYWGLILCKYGIEYVDDPATFKKIPTCHRASFDSIISDDDYKSALENADILQRAIYEEQAKEIDRIQKDILALAQNEEKYDVFICYKETDENGKRTQDSVIANDIYYELTKEGYKVFYAAITLEGKLGSAYEPIIFAALNSAKVMLAIGTKPEYFNAVWVKNEWSRFLKIIKNDRSKYIFPCYRDMDAYDLPEEFAHLQAQDMSKIGFINEIVRGIKKVIVKNEPKVTTVVKETVVTNTNANIEPLLKRVFMFLENAQWDEADTYCEKVLDIDPECTQAYLGKLLASLKISSKDRLEALAKDSFENNLNYVYIMRHGDKETKAFLQNCIKNIKERNAREAIAKRYNDANTAMNKGDYAKAIILFSDIIGYENSEELIEICRKKAKEKSLTTIYEKGKELMEKGDFSGAIDQFAFIRDYKDSENLIEICKERQEAARKDAILEDAKRLIDENTFASIEQAIEKMSSIRGWRDTEAILEEEYKYLIKLENDKKTMISERQNALEKMRFCFQKRNFWIKFKHLSTFLAFASIIGMVVFLLALDDYFYYLDTVEVPLVCLGIAAIGGVFSVFIIVFSKRVNHYIDEFDNAYGKTTKGTADFDSFNNKIVDTENNISKVKRHLELLKPLISKIEHLKNTNY